MNSPIFVNINGGPKLKPTSLSFEDFLKLNVGERVAYANSTYIIKLKEHFESYYVIYLYSEPVEVFVIPI